MDQDGNVDAAWMTRVHEVVDYVISKGAPVIIGEWGTSNVDAGEGKTVKEFNITFGGELVFKGNCSDVAKSLLALGNLYKLWNTNPTFNTVDTYTQQLNQYLPFTVTQNSTNITAQGKFITTMKGITHEEYQPAVAKSLLPASSLSLAHHSMTIILISMSSTGLSARPVAVP